LQSVAVADMEHRPNYVVCCT